MRSIIRVAADRRVFTYPVIPSLGRLFFGRINQCPFTLHSARHFSTGVKNGKISQSKSKALRLMPLGGSVTRGVGSSDGNGYRYLLLQKLQASGLDVCMVGSRTDGTMHNNDHEGWRGFRISEIERKARMSVKTFAPNIFTVNAGSNDCLQCFEIDEAGRRMGDLLEYLWSTSPQSTVLLSTLLVSAKDVDSLVRRVNDQFRTLAERKESEGKKVVLVDMYSSEGPDNQDLVDGIHPCNEGYEKMAKLWKLGVEEALRKAFIVP